MSFVIVSWKCTELYFFISEIFILLLLFKTSEGVCVRCFKLNGGSCSVSQTLPLSYTPSLGCCFETVYVAQVGLEFMIRFHVLRNYRLAFLSPTVSRPVEAIGWLVQVAETGFNLGPCGVQVNMLKPQKYYLQSRCIHLWNTIRSPPLLENYWSSFKT